jgi:hypothetical protein
MFEFVVAVTTDFANFNGEISGYYGPTRVCLGGLFIVFCPGV